MSKRNDGASQTQLLLYRTSVLEVWDGDSIKGSKCNR